MCLGGLWPLAGAPPRTPSGRYAPRPQEGRPAPGPLEAAAQRRRLRVCASTRPRGRAYRGDGRLRLSAARRTWLALGLRASGL